VERPSRRERSLRLGALLAALLTGLLLATTAVAAGHGSRARVLISFKPGTSASHRAAVLRRAGANDRAGLARLGIRVATVPRARLHGALRTLRSSSAVGWAERDLLLQPQDFLPSDPSFPRNYALAGGAWGWLQTHTTEAWEVTRGDPSVVVAVLDTGLKTQGLADFDGQLVPGWNVLDGSSDTSTHAGNHGTYVAGVVALALDNGVGNAGYCPGCRLMPVQVGTDSGAYLSDIAKGLTWAADRGARVGNMSWAGPSSSATLASAVAYARSKGMVLTAAAGNSNCNCTSYPAATPGVLGVAGTDQFENKDVDSNYGAWVTLAAPESNMTAWPTINGAPGYAPVGGTSLAAPVVAGIAGLLFSADPALTGAQVEQALEVSAVPVSFPVTYGRVDALAALQALGLTRPVPVSAPVNLSPPQVLVSTNGSYDSAPLLSAPQPGDVLVRGQGGWRGSAPLSLSSVQWQRCDALGICTTVATAAKYTVPATDSAYFLRLRIVVSNGLGSVAALSPLTAPVGGSTVLAPPVNTSPPVIAGVAQVGERVSATVGAWSGSPISYAYDWRRCDALGAGCASIPGASGASYLVQTADVGATLRVTVTAANSSGSTAVSSSPSSVVAPQAATTQTTTFSGSLNQKNPVRRFAINIGSGSAHAELSFSRCGSLSLVLSRTDGGAVADSLGPSVVVLDSALSAGAYAYQVSGGRCSFTLTVTAVAP
jgi:subtilisin family serine protease